MSEDLSISKKDMVIKKSIIYYVESNTISSYRFGQALYRAFDEIYPEKILHLTNSKCDPYYFCEGDYVIDLFISYLYSITD